MSRLLYFDCFSGISGDMTLGALLDAGLPFEELKRALGSLAVSGYDVSATRVLRAGVSATKFSVTEHPSTSSTEAPAPKHTDAPKHHHPHRHLSGIFKLIDGSALSAQARDRAKAMFQRL